MVKVSVHNVTTHAQAEATGEDWGSATMAALRKCGERGRFGIATNELVGSGCRRIQVGTPASKRLGDNAVSLGYVYTVSTLSKD